MGKSYVRIIQAIVFAVAILALLLTTPSLEAKTRTKHKHKKMKIVFDGNETAAPQGELGDEIVQPRSKLRSLAEPKSVVHLRGSSVDTIWEKSKTASRAKPRVDETEDNPDLMEPIGGPIVEAPASSRSKSNADLLAASSSVDESALGSFKKSKKKLITKEKHKLATASRPKKLPAKHALPKEAPIEIAKATVSAQSRPLAPAPVKDVAKAETIQPLPEPIMEFEEVKPKAVSRPTVRSAPSRIYLRNVQPVVSANSLATRVTDGPSEFTINFAFENTTSLGRKYELETTGGRNFTMKNELFLGTTHSTGWGAKFSADYITTSNDDSQKDLREMGDPSVIVEHPSLYQDRDLKIYGQGRYYVPVAAASRAASLQHFAYSLFADAQLIGQLNLKNEFTPRYYYQATYANADAFSLIYDATEVSKRFDWLSTGLGQRTQVESHEAIDPGTSVEVYPFVDFLGIPNTVFEAKMYIPVLVNGIVNGAPGSPAGPTSAGFSNLQAEFFARLSF